MIKFLNAQSVAPIKIHRQLCQVYSYTRLDGQHISCRSPTGRCLIIIHPIARTSRPNDFHLFLHLKKFLSVSAFSEQRGGDEYHSGSDLRRQTSTTQSTKVGPTVRQMSQFRRNMLKNSQTLAVSVPINWVLFL